MKTMKFKQTNKITRNKIWTHSLKQWVRVYNRAEYKGIVRMMIKFDNEHLWKKLGVCISPKNVVPLQSK